MRKTRISNLFKRTAGFVGAEPGAFDRLVVDESNRLVSKTRFNSGENQVKEIIHAANCSIFLIDRSSGTTEVRLGSGVIPYWLGPAKASENDIGWFRRRFECGTRRLADDDYDPK
jgi:hypothetical protein